MERLDQLLQAVTLRKEATREQLYSDLYGPKNLTGKLVLMANRNLTLQIDKLVKDGLILKVTDDLVRVVGSKL